MERFYFTYGPSARAFQGGWTTIETDSIEIAHSIFKALHPTTRPDIYTEEQFLKTEMPAKGNHGAFCHERIIYQRTLMDQKGANSHA